MDPESHVGRRVREIRARRGLSLTACAQLAGIGKATLHRIETGEQGVSRRTTLESLAAALRVAPSELTGQPHPPADPITMEARTGITALEVALSAPALGDTDDPPRRPWGAVALDLQRLNDRLRPAADYGAQAGTLPGLLDELHGVVAHEPAARREALVGLLDVYHASEELAKTLGVPGLPSLAAAHARTVAEEISSPEHLALAEWVRVMAIGPADRERMHTVAVRAADDLRGRLDDPAAAQVFGALHLSAALAAVISGDDDRCDEHLREAQQVAEAIDDGSEPFGLLYFGRHNVGIWRVSLAVEHGDPGRATELARDVDPDAVPSQVRQATFYADLGRGLATRRGTTDGAIEALTRSESIAPLMFRNNPYIRETVGDLLRRARREAGGRELRGMAHRMGFGA